ncbi:MATE family efflux transporter [Bacteroidota bacterium]
MNKRILQLAIPNIISNITIPLLGMVDIGLMGHLDDPVYMGAIGLGTTVLNIIYWTFAFLRISTVGLTAQAFGKKNFRETSIVLSRAILIAFIAGILIIFFRKPIANLSFIFIKGSNLVELYAKQYFYIRIVAAPATIGLLVLTGWFIGMQNTKTPMYIALIANILNIVFNFIFVKGLDMKSDGVAYGTVLAQYGGLIFGIIVLLKYYKKVIVKWTYKKMIEFKDMGKFFKLNADVFVRMIAIIFVFTFFNFKSAEFGDDILALNNILLQFFFFFSFLADGFAIAGEALVGKYIGAKDMVNIKIVIKYLFYWGFGIAIFFSILYIFCGKYLMLVLTNIDTIIELGSHYKYWIWILPVVTVMAFIWDGIYIGATATKAMRNTMLFASLLVFYPLFLLLENKYQNHALWISFLIFMFTRGLLQTFIFRKAILSRIDN